MAHRYRYNDRRMKCPYCGARIELSELDDHTEAEHRPHQIVRRMADIERAARSQEFTDSDWAVHPLAVEYRALMREWWALPSVPYDAARMSSTFDLPMTAKGASRPADWFTRGRKKLLDSARRSGECCFTVAGTEYRLWSNPVQG